MVRPEEGVLKTARGIDLPNEKVKQVNASLASSLSKGRWGLMLAIAVIVQACFAQEVLAQRWPDEHVNGPFAYHADFSLRPFYPLLSSVSKLKTDVPEQLGLGEVGEPIHLFLFQRQATYKQYVSRYFPAVPNRPALFVKQRGPGMVFARLSPEFAVDLRHETTHAVLHSILPMVPLWLDEGLGEYFEVSASKRIGGHGHLAAVKSKLVRWRKVPSIEKLEEIGDLAEMHGEQYRNSWAWVHFMLHGPPEAKLALQDYLQQIEARVPPGNLSLRLRRAVPNLEQAFLNHFRQRWAQ
jgi:hypothetical protein